MPLYTTTTADGRPLRTESWRAAHREAMAAADGLQRPVGITSTDDTDNETHVGVYWPEVRIPTDNPATLVPALAEDLQNDTLCEWAIVSPGNREIRVRMVWRPTVTDARERLMRYFEALEAP